MELCKDFHLYTVASNFTSVNSVQDFIGALLITNLSALLLGKSKSAETNLQQNRISHGSFHLIASNCKDLLHFEIYASYATMELNHL